MPPMSGFGLDKAIHFLIFGLLATGIIRVFKDADRCYFHLFLVVLLTSLLGTFDELHQSVIPGRYMEFYDWVADTLGAVVAVVSYHYWGRYRQLLEWRFTKHNIAHIHQTLSTPVAQKTYG